MRTKALSFLAPRRVDVIDVPVGQAQTGDLLVTTLYSGISSGTEMLAFRGEIDVDLPLDETLGALSGTFSYPFRYGYSCVGRVETSRGDVPSGSLVFAYHPHQGSFVVSARDAVVLEGTDARIATLFPLVETAFQLSLDTDVRRGEVVAVFGLGVVGTLTAVLLARSGASVVAVEPLAWRRKLGIDLGLEVVTPEEAHATVLDLSGGKGADHAVEASGNARALAQALTLLGHERTAVVASWYGKEPVSLPLGRDFHRRRLTIRSSQVSTIPARLSARWNVERRRQAARSLLDELPLDRLATHEFPLDDAQRAFDAIDAREEGLMHVALRY